MMEFKVSLDYRVSFRTARVHRETLSQKASKQINKPERQRDRETERDRETDGDRDVANTNAQ